MHFGEIGFDLDRTAIAGQRSVQLAGILQQDAQVVVRNGGIRIECHCPAATGNRSFELSKLSQGVAQIAMRSSEIGFYR